MTNPGTLAGAMPANVSLSMRPKAAAGLANDVEAVMKDFVPPSYPLEIELQNLAAVQECTSRELLPETFAKLERVGEQAVMLDAAGTVARGINETGARVWELIDGRRTVAEIARELDDGDVVGDVL